jgi:hypothetical protein
MSASDPSPFGLPVTVLRVPFRAHHTLRPIRLLALFNIAPHIEKGEESLALARADSSIARHSSASENMYPREAAVFPTPVQLRLIGNRALFTVWSAKYGT